MKKSLIAAALLLTLGMVGCQKNNQSQSSSSMTASSSSTVKRPVKVTLHEIWHTFTEQYKEAVVTSIELDTEHGTYWYEVKGVDREHEYSLKINASDGKKGETETEKLDADEAKGVAKSQEGIDESGLQTLTEVTQLALSQVGSGKAVKWELEHDNGSTVWDVEVEHDHKTTVVKIDAYSGEILTTKEDN